MLQGKIRVFATVSTVRDLCRVDSRFGGRVWLPEYQRTKQLEYAIPFHSRENHLPGESFDKKDTKFSQMMINTY